MTLPALEKGIQKAHTPSAETIMVDFVYNIKEWIEPCLNKIKNHVYPHSYRFSKRDGKGEMKYKAWAKDKNWLPEGKGLRMLHSIPKGTPCLVKPDTRKLLDIKQLEDCVAKCKRLTAADRNWWSSFISNEKDYRQRWSDPSDEILQNYKKKEWPLKMLKRFKQLEDTTEGDPDQLQREQNLNDLLRKADRCPNVSYYKTQTASVTWGKWEIVLDNLSYVINSNR